MRVLKIVFSFRFDGYIEQPELDVSNLECRYTIITPRPHIVCRIC